MIENVAVKFSDSVSLEVDGVRAGARMNGTVKIGIAELLPTASRGV